MAGLWRNVCNGDSLPRTLPNRPRRCRLRNCISRRGRTGERFEGDSMTVRQGFTERRDGVSPLLTPYRVLHDMSSIRRRDRGSARMGISNTETTRVVSSTITPSGRGYGSCSRRAWARSASRRRPPPRALHQQRHVPYAVDDV